MELQFKLADRMAERNLTVRDLSALSGLRLATISDIMNGNRSSINFQHLTMLMVALRLSKVSDLIDIYTKYYSDWWDSGFSTLGRRISDRIYLWAAGFQMAWKQLSENINK